ncbi:type II secretion system protein GspC [Woeseia oceani]|uniref:Type II secretion system protein GspC n=1 Tax=Woeseia oceani TaxID=1548547 RepID=A0A193LFA3_9GAMM|nr:type II secretion system protein GspC [Woeseia oceani]ANO51187.1 type II secretion system protein GspC [Woeseia oceani]
MTLNAKWSDFSNLDSERLLAMVSRELPRWLTLVLIIVFGWQLARLTWLLVPAPAAGDPITAPATAAVNSARSAQSADVQLIAASHLFGEANAEQAPVQQVETQPVEDLAETNLSLILKGTIAAADSANSIAIIADNRNDEKIYSIRDTVAPGATLHAVYTDRVVLSRSGALEVLKLPKEFPESTPRSRRNVSAVNRAAVTEDASDSIQNIVAQNVTKLADVIRPTPYFVNGQQQGYRVYPGRDRRQFAALGLRPGDLIKDIDGAALTDPQQAMQIFQNLGTAEQVSVTVERNGQPQTLVLNTNQLQLDNQ